MLCRLELNIHGQDERSNLRGGKWTSSAYNTKYLDYNVAQDVTGICIFAYIYIHSLW